MEKLIRNFRDDRINAILRDMPKSNAEYAAVDQQSRALYDLLGPILSSREEVTISPSDCGNFQEYLDQEASKSGITFEVLYQQGYLDCVRLLRTLGVLA